MHFLTYELKVGSLAAIVFFLILLSIVILFLTNQVSPSIDQYIGEIGSGVARE